MSPKRIKALRETHLGLTQAELARTLGVARLTISQYEIGFRQPRSTVLIMFRVLESLSRPKAEELVNLLRSYADEPSRKPKGRRA